MINDDVFAVFFEDIIVLSVLTASSNLSCLDAGTSVMKVIATDADEPQTNNSLIAYSLLDQTPNHDMFYITRDGIIKVKKSTLDREVFHN